MTVRRHPVRQHPRRTATGVSVVGQHMRGEGVTRNQARRTASALPDVAIRRVGNCQICERDIKLEPHVDRMVHHGYERPGDGAIHGDCFGVGEPPYELSCELVKRFRSMIQSRLNDANAFLAKLNSGTIEQFTVVEHPYPKYQPTKVTYTRAQHGGTYKWDRALQSVIHNTESSIRFDTDLVHKLTRRIDDWGPRPIRTVEELTAELARKSAVNIAARDAQRAVRDAKIAATTEKRRAVDAKRRQIRDEFMMAAIATAARKAAGEDVQKDLERLSKTLGSEAFRKACDGWLHKLNAGPLERWEERDRERKGLPPTPLRNQEFDLAMLYLGLARVRGDSRIEYLDGRTG
jgi:hypothetical protein